MNCAAILDLTANSAAYGPRFQLRRQQKGYDKPGQMDTTPVLLLFLKMSCDLADGSTPATACTGHQRNRGQGGEKERTRESNAEGKRWTKTDSQIERWTKRAQQERGKKTA